MLGFPDLACERRTDFESATSCLDVDKSLKVAEAQFFYMKNKNICSCRIFAVKLGKVQCVPACHSVLGKVYAL